MMGDPMGDPPSVSLPLRSCSLAMMLRSVLLAIATLVYAPGSEGNMYDVIDKHKLAPPECANGCAAWADVAKVMQVCYSYIQHS